MTDLSVQFFNSSLLVKMFWLGLSMGMSHCIFMCGGFINWQISMRLSGIGVDDYTWKTKIYNMLLLSYHFGKSITYGLIGIILFSLGNLFKESIYLSLMQLIIFFIFAVTLLLYSLNKIYFLKYNKFMFSNLGSKIPIIAMIQNIFVLLKNKCDKMNYSAHGYQGVILGMLLGLLPCGMIYMAGMMVAMQAGSIADAFLAMFVYAWSVGIPLFLFSGAFGFLLSSKYKNIFNIISLMIIFYYGVMSLMKSYHIMLHLQF